MLKKKNGLCVCNISSNLRNEKIIRYYNAPLILKVCCTEREREFLEAFCLFVVKNFFEDTLSLPPYCFTITIQRSPEEMHPTFTRNQVSFLRERERERTRESCLEIRCCVLYKMCTQYSLEELLYLYRERYRERYREVYRERYRERYREVYRDICVYGSSPSFSYFPPLENQKGEKLCL